MSDPHSNAKHLPLAHWSAAVFAGLSLLGCPEKGASEAKEDQVPDSPPAQASSGDKDAKDKECCMGLNECKGQGGCAVPESHSCAGKNECKGQGGCNMHCPQ